MSQSTNPLSLHETLIEGDKVHILDKRIRPPGLWLKIFWSDKDGNDLTTDKIVPAADWDGWVQEEFKYPETVVGMLFLFTDGKLTQIDALHEASHSHQ